MRSLLLVGVLCCDLLVDLALLVSTSDDAVEPFDPFRPATLLPIVAGRLHTLESHVRALDVRDLFDVLAAPYREPAHREIPTQHPSRSPDRSSDALASRERDVAYAKADPIEAMDDEDAIPGRGGALAEIIGQSKVRGALFLSVRMAAPDRAPVWWRGPAHQAVAWRRPARAG